MRTIYVDESVGVDPDLADRVGHLVDAGHQLILIGPKDHPATTALPWSDRRSTIGREPIRGSWYLTADPATCAERIPGVRTVLIGPREAGLRPTTRCDASVRDLREAVLEILAADAMSDQPTH